MKSLSAKKLVIGGVLVALCVAGAIARYRSHTVRCCHRSATSTATVLPAPATMAPPAASTGPLNPYKNPEDQPPAVSFAFNQPWAKPGPYVTALNAQQETGFRAWAAKHPRAVSGELDNPQADYDVRGQWLAAQRGDPNARLVLNKWDGTLHGSDRWKTPYNGSFSNESIYATADAPRWVGDRLKTADGRLVADETPAH